MSKNTYPESMGIRVARGTKAKFEKRAKSLNVDPSVIHREILDAFIDGRLTIQHDPKKKELYA